MIEGVKRGRRQTSGVPALPLRPDEKLRPGGGVATPVPDDSSVVRAQLPLRAGSVMVRALIAGMLAIVNYAVPDAAALDMRGPSACGVEPSSCPPFPLGPAGAGHR